MKVIPKMPDKYKGEYSTNTTYTNTTPRKWTTQEIKFVEELIKQGYTAKEIATSIDRSETSVSIKIKRLHKKDRTYNKGHLKEKNKLNNEFLKYIQPKTILDLYCGATPFYKGYKVVTNDINKEIKADYNEDAYRLLCKLYFEKNKYDLIDLDPFGSAYDCFDLAIKMAKKGLAITLGELGHKRWKRLDYVRRYYGINNLKDFTIENLIKHIQQIGLRNKKELIIWNYAEWQNIGRVYFEIKDIKITEQWEKGE